MSEAYEKASLAKEASKQLAQTTSQERNTALLAMADALERDMDLIIEANKQDVQRAREQEKPESLIDRLLLDEERIAAMADAMREVAKQPELLGKILSGSTMYNGIVLEKITVPMGVVAMIYEARPNVTTDAAALAIKTANAIVLRGGSMAHDSNEAICKLISEAASKAGLPEHTITWISSTDYQESQELMGLRGLIDLLIPRGSQRLIDAVVQNAKVPVIETGTGNNHVYVEKSAKLEDALNIIVNAKTQRTGVCNAIENILIDEAIAEEFLPHIFKALQEREVEILADEAANKLGHANFERADEDDFAYEFLSSKISVGVVKNIEEAIEHINRFGSRHSEAIVTQDYEASQAFTQGVDAAVVYVNASTRFSDGGLFGLGAEIGISTQKLHARGPMGAEVLVSTKYIARGSGQVRS
ncbi:MAG: glutamate-5-semialdehyde dehydrogenase [Coriobacteriia bacterium]|nr:glutamate-5-semialdehyde dehydrogenase [Coriobacteriia bacterium]